MLERYQCSADWSNSNYVSINVGKVSEMEVCSRSWLDLISIDKIVEPGPRPLIPTIVDMATQACRFMVENLWAFNLPLSCMPFLQRSKRELYRYRHSSRATIIHKKLDFGLHLSAID